MTPLPRKHDPLESRQSSQRTDLFTPLIHPSSASYQAPFLLPVLDSHCFTFSRLTTIHEPTAQPPTPITP